MHPTRLIVMLLPITIIGCEPHRQEAAAPQAEASTLAPDAVQPETQSQAAVTAVQTASNSAVNATVTFQPAQCKAGEKVQCAAKLKIGDGWHIYAMKGGAGPSQPTRIKLELPSWLKEEGEWKAPEPQVNLSHFGPEMIHSGEVSISKSFTVSTDAPVGVHHIPCSLSVQACNASRCLPPETFSLSLPITVLH